MHKSVCNKASIYQEESHQIITIDTQDNGDCIQPKTHSISHQVNQKYLLNMKFMESEIKMLTAATMRMREITGASMLSCKYAIQAADNHDDAIKFLFISGICDPNSKHPIISTSSQREVENSLAMKVREFIKVPALQAKRALQVSDGDIKQAVNLLTRATSSFDGEIDILRFANKKQDPIIKVYEDKLIGSHLISPRGRYDHHGIYSGNGKVIHYGGLADGLSSAPIEEVLLSNFSKGNDVFVKIHPQPAFDSKEILRRAKSRLGENAYSIFLNNCEHFCNWCILDKSESHQINELAKRMISIGGGLVSIGGRTAATAAAGPVAGPAIGLIMIGLGIYKIVDGVLS